MAGANQTTTDLGVISRAYEREKRRRKEAESVLEAKSRELFLSGEEIRKRNKDLLEANHQLEQQAGVIKGLTSQYGDVTNELQLAATVQHDLLPPPLLIPSIHAAGKFRPAHYLAGDGYDYHLINDHTFAFYVVDVAGHGIASALVSFAIQKHLNSKKSLYGNYERRKEKPLDEAVLNTVTELNTAFCFHEIFLQFFTMVYGLVDLRTGVLSFCQAGHPAPIIYDTATGTLSEHGTGGFPAGMFVDSEFTVHQVQLKENDRLVIYSDGVTDCEDADGAEYGIDRFKQGIIESSSLGVIDATHHLEEGLLDWTGSDDFGDDVSLLVIDFKGTLEKGAK